MEHLRTKIGINLSRAASSRQSTVSFRFGGGGAGGSGQTGRGDTTSDSCLTTTAESLESLTTGAAARVQHELQVKEKIIQQLRNRLQQVQDDSGQQIRQLRLSNDSFSIQILN